MRSTRLRALTDGDEPAPVLFLEPWRHGYRVLDREPQHATPLLERLIGMAILLSIGVFWGIVVLVGMAVAR